MTICREAIEIDLRAQGGDPVLVGELHARLPMHQRRQHVVAEGQVGADAEARQQDRGDDAEQPRGESWRNRDFATEIAIGQMKGQARPRGLRRKCRAAHVVSS